MTTIAIARRAALAAAFAAFAVMPALAQDGSVGLVEKKVFAMPAYTTVGSQTIRDVKVGWESYGQLNAARDNVVIVPHFFTANSHAAGRYSRRSSTSARYASSAASFARPRVTTAARPTSSSSSARSRTHHALVMHHPYHGVFRLHPLRRERGKRFSTCFRSNHRQSSTSAHPGRAGATIATVSRSRAARRA